MRYMLRAGDGLTGEKARDVLVQELGVGGIRCGAGGVSPEGWNREQGDSGNIGRLKARIANRKVHIAHRRHVEDGRLDRAQRKPRVAVEARRSADIVLLPSAALE